MQITQKINLENYNYHEMCDVLKNLKPKLCATLIQITNARKKRVDGSKKTDLANRILSTLKMHQEGALPFHMKKIGQFCRQRVFSKTDKSIIGNILFIDKTMNGYLSILRKNDPRLNEKV